MQYNKSSPYNTYNPGDSLRFILAQAGSSVSLLCFLVIIKMLMFQLLSQGGGQALPSVVPTQDLSVPQTQVFHEDKRELQSSLHALQQSPECSKLLQCLDYGLELRVNNASDYEWCKRNYVKCKSQGLLHHLNRLLEAVDERN